MTEIWKDIEGYEGYQVSNMGRIRSTDRLIYHKHIKRYIKYKGKVLKASPCQGGYLRISNPGIKVHRAVALAFVPGYFEGAEVNHKDENVKNNRADNLEWVTHKENISYGSHNSKVQKYLEESRGTKIAQYTIDDELIAVYPSQAAAARATGAYQQNIFRCVKTGGTTNGFKFKYV